jgi:sirohydrochlorin cobaltochelatase
MPHTTPDRAILMVAHGSRDPEAREEYRRVHAALAARLAPFPVVFSVLEFPSDDGLLSIEDGWRQCLAAGAREVVTLPFFLFTAGHVRSDVPGELGEARDAGGWADLNVLPPLGAADEILDAVTTRALEAAGPDDGAMTGLILVGAGTSDPDSNGDLCKAARLLWERLNERFPLIEAGWVSLTRPTVGEAIDRCVRLGAERVVLVPYFLNTGVLLKRADTQMAEAQARHPAVSMMRASHIGLQPHLLDLLERRARAGLETGADRHAYAAVCGRPSCTSVVAGRLALGEVRAPIG